MIETARLVDRLISYQADPGEKARHASGRWGGVDAGWQGQSEKQRFASNYISAFLQSDMTATIKEQRYDAGAFDVSIISNDADLARVTKRAALVTNQLLVTQSGKITETVERFEDDSRGPGDFGYELTEVHLHGCSSTTLGQYVSDCLPLIQSGRILYYPRVSTTRGSRDRLDSSFERFEDLSSFDEEDYSILELFDLVVRGSAVMRIRQGQELARQLIEPLLTIEVPYLEGTSLADFCKIAADEADAWSITQSYFRTKTLGIETSSARAWTRHDLAQLQLEIADGVRALESELKRVRRKSAVQAAGAAIATVSATLVAIYGQQLADIVSILGASGGAWTAVSGTEQYFEARSKLRERPTYFLWLLSRAAH